MHALLMYHTYTELKKSLRYWKDDLLRALAVVPEDPSLGPATMSGGSQLPVTPILGDLTILLVSVRAHVCAHTHIPAHTINHKILKMLSSSEVQLKFRFQNGDK